MAVTPSFFQQVLPRGTSNFGNIGQRSYRHWPRFEPMPRWPLNGPDVAYAIICHGVEKIDHVSRRRVFP